MLGEFLQEYRSATNPVRVQRSVGEQRTFAYHREDGSLGVVLFEIIPAELPDTVDLRVILAAEPLHGDGTHALKWLRDLCDNHGVFLMGVISPIGSQPLNLDQLTAWYRRHGFDVQGKQMQRRPQQRREAA